MSVESLQVYQEAMRIGEEVWSEVSCWEFFAKKTLGDQLVRSVDSIAANISEGYGRYHFAENKKFCYYARGSLDETITHLTKALNRNLIQFDKATHLIGSLRILKKRLNAYIRTIGPKPTDK